MMRCTSPSIRRAELTPEFDGVAALGKTPKGKFLNHWIRSTEAKWERSR
jgi:hypothetical protein